MMIPTGSNLVATRKQEFWRGARATLPMIVGAIPFGIIFGALAINAGLSVAATMGFSLIVYAGSAQFVAAGLVSAGASVGIIVLTTFFVNHHLPQRWLLPLGFWLTDETYAAVIARFRRSEHEAGNGPFKHWFQLGSSVAMYVNWQLCTVIGIVTGTRLEAIGSWGLEFALVVTFIGIVVPLIRRWPMLVCALVAGGCALVFRDLPHQLGLIVASLLGIVVGFIVELISGDTAPGNQSANGELASQSNNSEVT